MIPKQNGKLSRCEIYNLTLEELLLNGPPINNTESATIVKCNRWVYDRAEVPYESIATEVYLILLGSRHNFFYNQNGGRSKHQ